MPVHSSVLTGCMRSPYYSTCFLLWPVLKPVFSADLRAFFQKTPRERERASERELLLLLLCNMAPYKWTDIHYLVSSRLSLSRSLSLSLARIFLDVETLLWDLRAFDPPLRSPPLTEAKIRWRSQSWFVCYWPLLGLPKAQAPPAQLAAPAKPWRRL